VSAINDPPSDLALEDPTDPSTVAREDPTDPTHTEDPTDLMGEREQPTAPGEPHTGRLRPVAPWLAGADPVIADRRPADPMFWPVVVFVGVLVLLIGFFLFNETRHHAGHPQSSGQ